MKKVYHLPARAQWKGTLPADERARIENAATRAIQQVIRQIARNDTIMETVAAATTFNFQEVFQKSRLGPQEDTYSVPSYDRKGEPESVELRHDDEVLLPADDKVISSPPPFQDAAVLSVPGPKYIHVRSTRYATSNDMLHAVIWGKLLFATTSWVLVSRATKSDGKLYYVAALETRVTLQDLNARPTSSATYPGTYTHHRTITDSFTGGYKVEAVFLANGEFTLHSQQALDAFLSGIDPDQRLSPFGPIDPQLVQSAIFSKIDEMLSRGDSDSLERAADLLGELDQTAFSLLKPTARIRYIEALIRSWTSEPQEKAIIEIFKSVEDQNELKLLIQKLKDAKLWDQLFDDLDSELWSLLVVVGKKFGGIAPLTFERLLALLLEAKLIQIFPSLRVTDHGVEPTIEFVDDAYEAARSFIRFIGGALDGVLMLITHPDKVLEGLDQIVRMIVTVQLARWGDTKATKEVTAALQSVGEQILCALKGAAAMGVGPAVERRIKWALIWEIASWFIGTGAIKAAINAVGVTERMQSLARILQIIGLIGKAAESERAVTKIEQLARILTKASKRFTEEDALLRALSRLPEEDVARLTRRLERLELNEGTDAAKLLSANSDIAATLRKAEVIENWATLAGGYTDELTVAFANLSGPGKLSADVIDSLIKLVPKGSESKFAKVVSSMPRQSYKTAGLQATEYLKTLASSSARMDSFLAIHHETFSVIYLRAQGDAAKLDQYLAALEELEKTLPAANRGTEYRRVLDQIARGDVEAWLQLEDARLAKFAPEELRLDSKTIDHWVDELLKDLKEPANGAQPVVLDQPTPPSVGPPPVGTFREALDAVDITGIPPETLRKYQSKWKTYTGKNLKNESDYIRFRYGHETGSLPKVVRNAPPRPRQLGFYSGVEKIGGSILQKVLDESLPAGSANSKVFPTAVGNCIPDHLPPGKSVIHLKPDGSVSSTSTGTPFSATFVGDSKYRDIIPTTDQTRAFAKLAAHSDDKRLVFYVRWQRSFGSPDNLLRDFYAGYRIPGHHVATIVGSGVREEAAKAGVTIELISDPLWK